MLYQDRESKITTLYDEVKFDISRKKEEVITLFKDPISSTKTYLETNMVRSGVLPEPNWFEITHVTINGLNLVALNKAVISLIIESRLYFEVPLAHIDPKEKISLVTGENGPFILQSQQFKVELLVGPQSSIDWPYAIIRVCLWGKNY